MRLGRGAESCSGRLVEEEDMFCTRAKTTLHPLSTMTPSRNSLMFPLVYPSLSIRGLLTNMKPA
jgi:hypothetical protein